MKKMVLLIAFIFLMSSCASNPAKNGMALFFNDLHDGLYDNSALLVDHRQQSLDKIISSVYLLKSRGKFKTLEGVLAQAESQGIGVAIGENIVITVDHVVSNYGLIKYTPFGSIEEPAEKLSEATYLSLDGKEIELETVLRDREADVAVFKAPRGLTLQPFPYAIGNSDELRMGNYIYLIGNPLSLGLNVREGIVSALAAPSKVQDIMVKPQTAFMISNGLNPGDSGGPVIAIRDGKYELVGLSQGTFVVSQRMGWALKINFIIEKISPRLKEHGLPFKQLSQRVYD